MGREVVRVRVSRDGVSDVSPSVDEVLISADDPGGDFSALGRVAQLSGDECMDESALQALEADPPDALIMRPRAVSELEAEAILELAVALSKSVAGLVIVVEPDDTDSIRDYGGSAIVMCGDVAAESLAGAEELVAEILLPIPAPEPREPLPRIPLILLQRLATHGGKRLEVGYPADLTDGMVRS